MRFDLLSQHLRYLHSHKDKYKSSFQISKIVEQSTLNKVPTFFVNL